MAGQCPLLDQHHQAGALLAGGAIGPALGLNAAGHIHQVALAGGIGKGLGFVAPNLQLEAVRLLAVVALGAGLVDQDAGVTDAVARVKGAQFRVAGHAADEAVLASTKDLRDKFRHLECL